MVASHKQKTQYIADVRYEIIIRKVMPINAPTYLRLLETAIYTP